MIYYVSLLYSVLTLSASTSKRWLNLMSDDGNSPKQHVDELSEDEDEGIEETASDIIHLDTIPTIGEAYKIGSLKPPLASEDESLGEAHYQPNPLLLDRVSLL